LIGAIDRRVQFWADRGNRVLARLVLLPYAAREYQENAMEQKTIAIIAGVRPNYMKVFPLLREIREQHDQLKPVLIHTGQHYDPLLNDVFFQDFNMPKPDHFLGVGSGSHGIQTGRIMIALDELFTQLKPDVMVVVGDVNSTLAGALVAVKRGIPTVHLEAGLRSLDRSMPEEINRIVADAISDLLLTSCRDGDTNLLQEGIPPSRIRFVGNIMIDSLVQILPRVSQSKILETLSVAPTKYVCVTLHRPSNVDDPQRLKVLWTQLKILARQTNVVFPVHPRTARLLAEMGEGIERSPILTIAPLGYLDFLRLQSEAAVVITDSGGVQEETSFLGIPCVTVRPNTERPVTIRQGTNRLFNPEQEHLLDIIEIIMRNGAERRPSIIEGWDGFAAGRALAAIRELAQLQ
jgi:UDP-N-acetylglucosamine 2-epimerase (non-hydrolysing)